MQIVVENVLPKSMGIKDVIGWKYLASDLEFRGMSNMIATATYQYNHLDYIAPNQHTHTIIALDY